MRLHEREAIYRQQNGVLTMDDMVRERKAQEAAAVKVQEKAKKTLKDATKGPALPLGDEVAR